MALSSCARSILATAHARSFTPLNAPMLATRIATLSGQGGAALIAKHDSIGAIILNDAARVFTDLRPDPDRMTSYLLVMSRNDDQLGGRLALSLLEIETYRLMALLAFPLAGEATELLTRIEAEAGHLASQLSQAADAEADRALLARLAPAMRACDTMARRQQAAIERIARTEQMLNTRVEVATEATNVKLLESMDKRAKTQLRLQTAVEGFSVFAIAYYALSLASYPLKAIEKALPGFDATLTGGALAPILLIIA